MDGAHDIVVYEEDPLNRALLQEWLAESGHRVRVGDLRRSSSPAACAGPCALVIASVYMPKHAGAQCLRDIQAAHPGTPVIAISGQFRAGLTPDGATAQTLRVRQVIAKPLSRQELIAAVRGILDASP
jgi:DNA-binding NtrC family response regulator